MSYPIDELIQEIMRDNDRDKENLYDSGSDQEEEEGGAFNRLMIEAIKSQKSDLSITS